MVSKAIDGARAWLERHFILLFGFVFYTSCFYEVRALGGHAALFGVIKHIFIFGLMSLMLLSIQWRDVRVDAFAVACCIWMLVNILLWVEYQRPLERYLRALGQVVFIFLFVTFLRQKPSRNPCLQDGLSKWFSPSLVAAFLAVLIALNVTGYIAEDVQNGFGNSRVNFSIWLIQVVALVIFSTLARGNVDRKSFLGCLMLLTPAYVLQNMTGGRSGLLGTLLLVSVFAYRWGGLRALFQSTAWLVLTTFAVAYFYPLITPENNLNVFRNLEPSDGFALNEAIAWLDRLSSYRISILITAFSTLSLKGLLLGMGIGNFVGWAPTYPELGIMEVHNVLLKILGEYGFFGFLSALFLVLLPFVNRQTDGRHALALSLQSIYVVVSMIHPDLMMTAINVSLIYFGCYAYSLTVRPDVAAMKRPA